MLTRSSRLLVSLLILVAAGACGPDWPEESTSEESSEDGGEALVQLDTSVGTFELRDSAAVAFPKLLNERHILCSYPVIDGEIDSY